MAKEPAIRTLPVILIFLLLPIQLQAQQELPPLEDGEGYLVVGIDMYNIFWTGFSIDGDGKLGNAHQFTTKELQRKLIYEIIKLPAGQYHWSRIRLKNYSWFSFSKKAFPMIVEAGRINYGGDFHGRAAGGEGAHFKILNRATAAIEYLENCCAGLLRQYTLQSGVSAEDPFLEYYSSLDHNHDHDPATKEQSESELEGNLTTSLTQDFFRRSKYYAPQLSPDGKLIAVFEQVDDVRQLMLLDPVHEYKHIIIAEKSNRAEIELNDVHWIDNDDLLFTYTVWGTDRMANAKVVFQDGQPVDIKLKVLDDGWYLVDPLIGLEDRASVVVYKEGKPNLHTIDINESETQVMGVRNRKLQNKINSTFSWMINRNGRVRAAVGIDEDLKKTLWYRTTKSNKWKAIWEGDPEVTIVPVLAWDDDRTLTVITNENSDHTLLTSYDRKTKTYGETIFEIVGSDVESVTLDPLKTRIVRVTTTQDGLIRHHYMGDEKALYPQLLDYETYGSEPYIIDQSTDGQRAIVQTSTSDDPGSYFLLDVNDRLSYRFGNLRPWISKFRIGSSRIIKAASSDGLEVESFLTMPDSATYPKPPLIVMPHGGPISVQDRQHFNSEVQLLATLGYAVLRTNYRGSSGYGKSFEEKGQRQWGRLIEDDIEASLDAVIDLNLVDASKVCIYGVSYGGYSALISAIRRPEKYRCAASYAGVTDMPLLFHAFSVNRSNIIRAAIERIVGDPEDELETMTRYSPVFNVDKLNVPVLLAHGNKDETVDFEHYERMLMMFEHFQKDVEHFSLSREGHGLYYLASSMTFYSRLDRFFRNAMDLPEPASESIVHEGVVWPEPPEDGSSEDSS